MNLQYLFCGSFHHVGSIINFYFVKLKIDAILYFGCDSEASINKSHFVMQLYEDFERKIFIIKDLSHPHM